MPFWGDSWCSLFCCSADSAVEDDTPVAEIDDYTLRLKEYLVALNALKAQLDEWVADGVIELNDDAEQVAFLGSAENAYGSVINTISTIDYFLTVSRCPDKAIHDIKQQYPQVSTDKEAIDTIVMHLSYAQVTPYQLPRILKHSAAEKGAFALNHKQRKKMAHLTEPLEDLIHDAGFMAKKIEEAFSNEPEKTAIVASP